MGKTLQSIALLLVTPQLPTASSHEPTAPPGTRRTLILTPTVALLQWSAEITKHTLPNSLRVCIFHGAERASSVDELAEYDVVLSTFSIVETGFRKERYGVRRKGQMVKEESVLHGVE